MNRSNTTDETAISEITIAPDGRIYIFGASRQVLQALDKSRLGDGALKQRVEHLQHLEAQDQPTLARGHIKNGASTESPRGE